MAINVAQSGPKPTVLWWHQHRGKTNPVSRAKNPKKSLRPSVPREQILSALREWANHARNAGTDQRAFVFGSVATHCGHRFAVGSDVDLALEIPRQGLIENWSTIVALGASIADLHEQLRRDRRGRPINISSVVFRDEDLAIAVHRSGDLQFFEHQQFMPLHEPDDTIQAIGASNPRSTRLQHYGTRQTLSRVQAARNAFLQVGPGTPQILRTAPSSPQGPLPNHCRSSLGAVWSRGVAQ